MSDSQQPADPNAIVQYLTNNDGTLQSLKKARGPIPPALQQQVADAIAAAEGDDDPDTTAETALAEVLAQQPDFVYLSITGTYYLGKAARHNGDCTVVTPSEALVGILERYGETEVDVARDLIIHASNAMGITYDPVLRDSVDAATSQEQSR